MLKHLILGMLVIGNYTQHPKRTLLLFADQGSQNTLKQQERLLQTDKNGLQKRGVDIKVYSPLSPTAKSNHVKSGFTVILIGADHGEKLRSHQPITTKKLFDLIDAMPMQKEIIAHSTDQED